MQVGRSLFGFGSELGVALLAVGIYLPVELSTPIFVGGLVAWGAGRVLARQKEQLGQAFDEVAARSASRRRRSPR